MNSPITPCFSLGQFVVYRVDPETKAQIVGFTVWINQGFNYQIRKEGHSDILDAYEQELVDWNGRFEFIHSEDDNDPANN